MIDYVALISDDVVAARATAGLPPLTDGAILVGDQHLFEQSAPPRIVFDPVGSAWGANDAAFPPSVHIAATQKPIHTDVQTFDVHCWGRRDDTVYADPKYDYDATIELYHQVVRSLKKLANGLYTLGTSGWTRKQKIVLDGREFVFRLAMAVPVTEAAVPYVPAGTVLSTQTVLRPPDGAIQETGCSS